MAMATATSDDEPATLLASIRDQRANNPLSILTLAEPILAEQANSQATHLGGESKDGLSLSQQQQLQQRQRQRQQETQEGQSHASGGPATPSLSPHTLAADLSHYRDLFAKLRFSYLEQVTKEKYLRSIVGEPPVLVSPDENAALEDRLAAMKATLKAKKTETDTLVAELEAMAVVLAERYDFVSDQLADLERLPREIGVLEEQVASAQAEVERIEAEMGQDEEEEDEEDDDDGEGDNDGGAGPGLRLRPQPRKRQKKKDGHNDVASVDDQRMMTMSLEDTEAEVEERRRQVREVDEQIAALQASLPAKTAECERIERELGELEGARNRVTASVREMQKLREEGGRDLLEERGRWLKAEEAVLRGLLSFES